MKYWLFLVMLIFFRVSTAETIAAISSPLYKYSAKIRVNTTCPIGYGQGATATIASAAACNSLATVINTSCNLDSKQYNVIQSATNACDFKLYSKTSGLPVGGLSPIDLTFYYLGKSFSCPSGYYLSDASGNSDSSGQYCTQPDSCFSPYSTREGSQCVKYCPSGTALNTTNGECEGVNDTSKTETQCKDQRTDPVLVDDGSLYAPELPDYAAASHFPLQFSRTYHGHNSPYIPANVTNNSTLFKTYMTNAGWKRYVQPSGYTGVSTESMIVLRPQTISGGVAIDVPKVPGYGYQLWRHNFSYALDVSNTSRVLLVPPLRDDKVVFVGSGTVLTANNLSGETLTKNTDGAGVVTWVYRDRTNFVRVFNAKGLLITEQDISGLSHHLTYDVANRLSAVTDDFGHSLSFSYDEYGRISVMTTPVGSVTYGYDDKGNLTSVTKEAGAETTTRTYVYDDARFSYALTGIIDEKGVRYTSWTYDDMGRVTDNHGVNSAEKTTLAYTDTTTTVTNPLGKADVYTYATTGGARRLVSVAGQASTSCLAANQNYTYYDNGLLKSKTDWKGNVTAYEYNGRGLVTKVTEAAGTDNARVTTTDWHATFALPLKVTQGNQVVTYRYDSQGRLTGQSVSEQ